MDPYGWFQWYFRYWLGRRSKDDKRQINRQKNFLSRFRGKLVKIIKTKIVKIIKDAGSKFDDYSISPKIRQILLHWDYELTKKDFFVGLTNQFIKISYYWFNRQEILCEAKERYSKEKAAEYYLQNKEVINEKSRQCYKNLSQEEKDKTKKYQRKMYQELVQYKREALKNK